MWTTETSSDRDSAGLTLAGDGGYGKFVGRVGGLAVALGIGAAIASFPGLANADATGSSAPGAKASGSDASSSGAADKASSSAPDTGASVPATKVSSSGGSTASSSDDADASDNSSAPKMKVSSSGGAITSSSSARNATGSTKASSSRGETSDPSDNNGSGHADATVKTTGAHHAPGKVTTASDSAGAERTSISIQRAVAAAGRAQTNSSASIAASAAASEQVAAADQTVAPAAAATAADTSSAGFHPVQQLISTVLSAFGISPTANGQPAAPLQLGIMATVLTWVREEIQRTFNNNAPVINYDPDTTSLTDDGTVVGNIGASDADGDSLKYSVAEQPANATISIDDNGDFILTPTTDDLVATTVDVTVTVRDTGFHFHGLDSLLNPFSAHETTVTISVEIPALEDRGDVYSITDYDTTDGIITAELNTLAPADEPVTFALGTAPSYGDVTVDWTTGDVQYTPWATSRLAVAMPGGIDDGDDLDTFTVVATVNGQAQEVSVSVPVLPAYGTQLSAISVGPDPVAVVVDDNESALWVLNNDGTNSTITAYDADTYAQLSTSGFAVGADSVAMILDPNSDLIYVVSRGDKQVWVIDPEQTLLGATDVTADPDVAANDGVPSPAVVAMVNVGNNPTGIAISSDGSKVYVTNTDDNTVTVIDTTDPNYATSTITTGSQPHGITISPDDSTIYVANYGDSTITAYNVVNDVWETFNSDPNPDGVAISPDGTYLYVTTQGGSTPALDIFTVGNFNGYSSQLVGAGPSAIAVGSDGTVYLTNSDAQQITAYDPLDLTYTAISVGTNPVNLALDEDNGIVYVANMDSGTLSAVSMTAQPPVKPDDATDTKGFDFENQTSNSVVFLGYYDPTTGSINPTDDYVKVGPVVGTIYQPGETQHWNIYVKGHGDNTHVYPVFQSTDEFPGAPASTWTVDFKYNPSNNTKYVGCSVDNGNGTCNHVDLSKGSSTIKLWDAANTIIYITPDNVDYQSVIVNNLCADGADAKCKFTATNFQGGVYYSDSEFVGTTVVNNTLTPLEYDTSQTYTYSETDSLTLGTKVSGGIKDVVNVEVSATYGYATTEAESYTSLIKVFIQPGYTGYVCAATPVARATGDFTITQGNTTYYATSTTWDSPDQTEVNGASRVPVWNVKEVATGTAPSCSGGSASSSSAGSGGGGTGSAA
ncbi:beta-propeller fold lactonase family protein [Mycobacterium sp. CVI_P3]|uniref:Beta-propeller fold lactonase family protein n=1 Tax=Mycobacterium pinniadriaticum TaxID=2994102 RepID=A0ABT3SMI0_9MYCO|nr:beta-propeller fold lactonase family protein [Mycobacterium pinniadriaticum]MCX2934307.1 beta-propeller fold lactonase family protein [Mycobacterium pinniadriaticum]MCX2940730.1 beta-propeller fold lactonase family protein [Mycobacterium pinniadriaticum]